MYVNISIQKSVKVFLFHFLSPKFLKGLMTFKIVGVEVEKGIGRVTGDRKKNEIKTLES